MNVYIYIRLRSVKVLNKYSVWKGSKLRLCSLDTLLNEANFAIAKDKQVVAL